MVKQLAINIVLNFTIIKTKKNYSTKFTNYSTKFINDLPY